MKKVKQNYNDYSNGEQLQEVKQFVKQTVKQPNKEQAQAPLKARQKTSNLYWRERIGVEPTVDTAGCLPTDLKSAESTGAHPLP